MKPPLFTVMTLLVLGAADAQDEENSLNRILKEAQATASWKTDESTENRLRTIREVALAKDVVSSPVSDRYFITALGGPIDLVHFLGLAIQVFSGRLDRDAALLAQWKDEGGENFEAGRTRKFPSEAHPDDLPSNALGALFGEELRVTHADPGFDLAAALRKFLARLEPVSHAITKRFSHQQIVMGLEEDADLSELRSRSEWFTARPLYVLHLVDPNRAKTLRTSTAALEKAGFRIRFIENKPLAIDRIARPRGEK